MSLSLKYESDKTEEEITNKLKSLVIKTEQIPAEEIANNEILKKVFQILKDTNYNPYILEKAVEHIKFLNNVNCRSVSDPRELRWNKLKNLKFQTREECLSYYTGMFFLDKIHLLKSEPSSAFLNSGLIELLPMQYFLKNSSNVAAKREFENNLKKGDYLFVEMVQTEFKSPHSHELAEMRIIAKAGDSFNINRDLVYHFNSNVFSFKNLEMERLGRNEIKSSEVLKVGILGIPSPHKKIVTTNMNSFKLSAPEQLSVNLGIVSIEDMPPFLKSFKTAQKFSCYASYLRSHPQFFHTSRFSKEIKSLGIDPHRIYSFDTNRDGLGVPPGRSTDALVKNAKEAIHNDALNHLELAKKYVEKKEYENAMEEFENSAKCWSENYKVYELRGKMYLSMSMNRRGPLLKKAMVDFEAALELNPSAQESKQCLSKIMVNLSKRLIKNRQYFKATMLLCNALRIFPENKDANTMLKRVEKLKKTRPLDADNLDLQTLEKKKELLKKKLKKEPVK